MPGQPLLDRGETVAYAGDEDLAAEDEAALVARAQRDPRRFEPLYARYMDPVYRYCHRCLGGREAAEDATGLVFAKALAALPGCRAEAFRPWLFAIAHNVIANAWRDERPTRPLADAAAFPDPGPSPEELALAAEERRSLRALLAHLPPGQREVVELRLSGLTGPETARVLGRSLGSVQIAQVRAFARLRKLLGGTAREDNDDDG